MAIGDDAVAAGMPLVNGNATGSAAAIDDYINETRDYIAQRAPLTQPVAKGGTGATTAAGARQNLGVIPAVRNGSDGTNELGLTWTGSRVRMNVDATNQGDIANTGDITGVNNRIDGLDSRVTTVDGRVSAVDVKAVAALQGNLYGDAYNRNITGTRRAAWLQDNGQLGYASSSERYKKFIRPEDVTDEQLLMLSLVSFQWRAAVATDDRREMGLIAERLVEAGLGWACFYDSEGRVEGINYEHVGLILLPAVQRLIVGQMRIEERLDALEGK